MNAQAKFYSNAMVDKVTAWEPATQRVRGQDKTLHGYALMSPREVLAFIETTKPLPRIAELLDSYTSGQAPLRTARELMRDLLNVEDYRSEIYDVIVRVYYPEDFAS